MPSPERLLPYKAFETLAQFFAYLYGIAVNAKVCIHLQRLEVRAISAVIPTSDGDVLAEEDVRVALAVGQSDSLHEGVMPIRVACQNALIVLTELSPGVVAQKCLYVYAEVSITIPTMLFAIFYTSGCCGYNRFHNQDFFPAITSVSKRGRLPRNISRNWPTVQRLTHI